MSKQGNSTAMRSTPDPSLRGLTTDILKSLDARQHLRAISLPSNSKSAFGNFPGHLSRQRDDDTETTKDVESMHRLAVLYHKRKNYEKAERLYQEALTIFGLTRGTMDAKVGQLLNNVARLYLETYWYTEAEPLLMRSLEIALHHHGAGSSKVARRLANLAELCVETDRGEEALRYFQQAIAIETRGLGPDAPQTQSTMRACAALLRGLGRISEAEPIEKMCHRARRDDRRMLITRRVALTAVSSAARLAGNHSAGERRRRADRRARSYRRSAS